MHSSVYQQVRSNPLFHFLPAWLQNPSPEIYLSNNYVVLDYENTITDGDGSPLNVENDLVLYVWLVVRNGTLTLKHTIGNVFSQDELFDDIRKADFVVAHNSKHELQWMHRGGYQLQDVLVADTMLAQRVIAGNRPWPLGLDDVAHDYGLPGKGNNPLPKMMKLGVCPSKMSKASLLAYCSSDVWNTYYVFLQQRQVMKDAGLLGVFLTRCIMTPFLAEIEFDGIHLNAERVLDLHRAIRLEYLEIEHALVSEFGDINYNSGQQVAVLLYGELGFDEVRDRRGNPIRNKPTKKFPDGVPKTDKDTILLLKPRTKRQKRFLELKTKLAHLNAKLTKSLKPFHECVTQSEDHRLRFKYNQHIAGTHRLSSNGTEFGVQGQNMDNKFKRVVDSGSDDDYVFEADYSKLEFNVASVLGNDDVAQAEVVNEFDVHKYSAAVMKVADEHLAAKKELDIAVIMEESTHRLDEIQKEERRLAKPFTFGPLTCIAGIKPCELRGSL